jgi:hypothetical protein
MSGCARQLSGGLSRRLSALSLPLRELSAGEQTKSADGADGELRAGAEAGQDTGNEDEELGSMAPGEETGR